MIKEKMMIKYNLEKDKVVNQYHVEFKPQGQAFVSIHEVKEMRTWDTDEKYFLFVFVSGTSVMNWFPEDYISAKNSLDGVDVEEFEIVQLTQVDNNQPSTVHVPTSYRHK